MPTPSLSRQERAAVRCRRILYALVFIMVFEGILRKLLSPLNMVIFFGKDLLCLAGLVVLRQAQLPAVVKRLDAAWLWLLLLFVPVLIATGFRDPLLVLFGLKQYLLYVVVAALVVVAFPLDGLELFRWFVFVVTLLLVPTAAVALLQNALPAGHWLNTGLSGESLEAFSAAGFLRVGSTFPFTAQYSWFLQAESFFLATSYFLPPNLGRRVGEGIYSLIYIGLLLVLIVSAFVTGGRTAVLGCGSTLALGLLLVSLKRPSWTMSRGVVIIPITALGLALLRAVRPQYFMAYDERAADVEGVPHNTLVASRVLEGLTSWTTWFWKQDWLSVLLGNGLGVMSNGADRISNYANNVRENFWTETDMATTFWEGGLYLGVLWYGFRLLCVAFCVQQWLGIREPKLASAAAVPLAYVVVQGVLAQLGMQPPLAIWWWMGIGIVLFLAYLERYRQYVSSSTKLAVAA